MPRLVIETGKIVVCKYTNYRGETKNRKVEVRHIWYGTTEYHPEPQWFAAVFDVKRGKFRDFAMKDMEPVDQ